MHAVFVEQQVQRENHAQQNGQRHVCDLAARLGHDAQRLVGSAYGCQGFLAQGAPCGIVENRALFGTGKVRDCLRSHGRAFGNAIDDSRTDRFELAAHECDERNERECDSGNCQNDTNRAAALGDKDVG